MEPTYDVVWPLAKSGVETQALAPRLATLDGATVGFLWDDMFRGDELFPALQAELTRRFPSARFVGYEEFGNIHGPDEHKVVAALGNTLHARHVDAVVAAVGC